jgi:beta-glucuronidase
MLYPQRTLTRSYFDLTGIWDLAREREGIDYTQGFIPEKQVAVPGSFNDLYVEEEFRSWMKGIWYSYRFGIPGIFADQRVVLRFGAVSYRAEVYLNGKLLGTHETGYTPFEFDVTALIHIGRDNLVCVRVDTILSAETVPMGNLSNKAEPGQIGGQYPNTPFDFFPYGGLHRPVSVCTTGKRAWVEEVIVTTEVEGAAGLVRIAGKVAGAAELAELFLDENGSVSRIKIDGGRFTAILRIPEAKLWGVYQPNLYHLRIRLLDGDDAVLDEYVQRFGVRTIQVLGNSLLLNGQPVYLQGFGRHEDFPIIGKGLNHSVNVRDHELLKWINANSYRTTHYPYSEELVRMAEEQGILLIAEAPAVSINFDYVTARTLETHLQALTELIERDRNSPAVIMWSVANEATSDREQARPYFKALAERARALDCTRPITMVTCKGTDDQVMDFFDVVSVNLYPGWYHLPGQLEAAQDDLREILRAMYEKFQKPLFIAEFGADTMAGQHSLPAEQWSEEYQTDLVLGLIDVMRGCDFVIGEHIWNFADFRTAQNFFRANGNRKGIFTRDRQPKMIARFLKQKWAVNRYA